MPKNILPTILIVIVLIAIGGWVWYAFFDRYHYAVVKNGVLYRDGIRSMHELDLTARDSHVKTIVSLVDDSEIKQSPFTDEQAYAAAHHITVDRVPIPLGGWPDGDQIRRFLAIVADPANQPVLVHCHQGVRRTGMLVAAYQMSVLGYTKDQAKAAVLKFGHSERLANDVEKFIDLYDPAAQQMTQTPQHSPE